MVEAGAVLKAPHATETVEVLATPRETTDRYRVRLTAPPGGGSGVTGLGPHVHRGVAEVFRVVEGTMMVRVGDETWPSSSRRPGHGPRPTCWRSGPSSDQLARRGRANPRTGMPPLPQVAVLLSHVPEAFTQPGIPGLLLRPLAVFGHLRGYRWIPPDNRS